MLTLVSPLGVAGLSMIVVPILRDGRDNDRAADGLWNGASRAARGLLAFGTVIAALVAVILIAIALEGLVSPDRANNNADYTTPVVYAALGGFWAGISWVARMATRRIDRQVEMTDR